MRYKTIISYEKEFMAWCKGEPILVGAPKSMEDASIGKLSWRKVNSFNDWVALDTKYVINDEYVEFRKALAEGKEVLYLSGNNIWQPFTSKNFTLPIDRYRIKPDKPKLKVGDWVKARDYTGNVIFTKYSKNQAFREGYYKKVEKWQPQEGEWCVFWNNNSCERTTAMFSHKSKLEIFYSIGDNTDSIAWENIAPVTFDVSLYGLEY